MTTRADSLPAADDARSPFPVTVDWRGRSITLEAQWVGDASSPHPVVVFLHEGLGSIAAWKDFPDHFCRTFGLRGLMYSRYGYGNSTPRPANERWTPDFMHQQAAEVLPALLEQLGIRQPWLFGHSDGASIALLHAALRPGEAAGVVVVAPHIFVEPISVSSIAAAREAYEKQDLRAGLARYHADVDSAFYGWNDVWLSPEFASWNITSLLGAIRCPLLAVQGEGDEYGTLDQIRGIARVVPGAKTRVLPDCGHWPHRAQREALTEAAGNFIISHLHAEPVPGANIPGG